MILQLFWQHFDGIDVSIPFPRSFESSRSVVTGTCSSCSARANIPANFPAGTSDKGALGRAIGSFFEARYLTSNWEPIVSLLPRLVTRIEQSLLVFLVMMIDHGL